jgi:hypothetical protein
MTTLTKKDLLETIEDMPIMRVALGDPDYTTFVGASVECDKKKNLILIC